jgi:ferric-dicitrate binding protein FerR (iron transport regulator)
LDKKNYEFYTASDFAKDEDFQQWILCPDLKNTSFWEKWMHQHPENQAAITEAISLVHSVQFRSYNLANSEKDRIWDNIWDKMNSDEPEVNPVFIAPVRGWKWKNWWKYAAAVIVGFVAVFSIWKSADKTTPSKSITFSEHTDQGEMKKLLLPDSSQITLNANTEFVFSQSGNVREVWMKGEGYFHVKHTKDNKEFIVHTYDNLSVKVLGTRFNVNTFGDKISVVLEHGSIQLSISDSTNHETQLYLKAGEMLTYNKATGDYTKRKVEAERFVSWTSGRLILDHYTLNDARAFMQNVFGKEMIIQDSTLLKSSISGSMPIIYKSDTMLLQFGKAFQLHFQKHGDEIWIEK